MASSTNYGAVVSAKIKDFGRGVRFMFFAAWAGLFLQLDEHLDSSAFDTPFAQLTINALARAIINLMLVVVLAVIWVKWAFIDGRRDYAAWAGFGAMVLIGIVVYALAFSP